MTETQTKAGQLAISHRRRWPSRIAIAGALLSVGGWVGLQVLPASEASRQSLASEADDEMILPVATLVIEPVQAYDVERAYTGEIQARRSSELGFEQGGEVTQIAVTEGMEVTEGAPLAYLNTQTLETEQQAVLAQLAVAQAQLQELEAGPRQEAIAAATATVDDIRNQLDLAELLHQRRQMLFTEGAIAQQDLDEVTYQVGSLRARLTAAQQQQQELQTGTRPEQIVAQEARIQQLQANLASLDVALGQRVLYAPFSGHIALRYVDEGAVVGSGEPVLRLVETGSWEARIGVPPQHVPRVGSAQTVAIGDRSYPAQVLSVLPEVDPASRTVTVLLDVDMNGVPSGQTARLMISDRISSDGYWVPTTALVPGVRGLWTVYTVTPDEDAQEPARFLVNRQEVEILHMETERVLVRGTLQPGDRLVAEGSQRLVPGQIVRLHP
ncbi:efflux RND transporter periplasmic adaptor subunit [Leptolyngbya sp. CCY15150]|uniref:efflux RND transporter periplasmic adaptor subunit n=1 Tax=Leptolyngbya sp. CCY15150 TaxID=2767772 RepID=UPI0019512C5E|nr:efflux RND transporter periplasmic adaptor subunit [Leptolyngbya sp. CCY15150]